VFGSDFDFDFLIALGFTFERAADIGECFAVASQIEDGNYESWVAAWLGMADRLHGIGQTAETAGHRVSASEAFLRASTYYGAAQWLTLGTPTPERITEVWTQHKNAFEGFLRNAAFPSETLAIPYQPDLPIPAYALLVDDSGAKRPWVILTNGSDGGYPESWAAGAAAALGAATTPHLRRARPRTRCSSKRRFRSSPTGKPWSPAGGLSADPPRCRPGKLVLTGVSQGGYWAPRAAAFEPRLAAVVADGGVMQVWQSWAAHMPPEAIDGLFHGSAAEQEAIASALMRDSGKWQPTIPVLPSWWRSAPIRS